jgi:TetR/AcrR family transcriptional repressor of nem operon
MKTLASPPRPSPDGPGTTASQILDVAERLAQTRGFNGFSYADIAAELGITKASLHYHFPGKADLGRAIIERYSMEFAAALEGINTSGVAAPVVLERYVELYARVLRDGRICLCGMLAAEYATLPDAMQQAIRTFFEDNEALAGSPVRGGGTRPDARVPGQPERRGASAHRGARGCDAARASLRRPGAFLPVGGAPAARIRPGVGSADATRGAFGTGGASMNRRQWLATAAASVAAAKRPAASASGASACPARPTSRSPRAEPT